GAGTPRTVQTLSQLRASGQRLTPVTPQERAAHMQAAQQAVTRAPRSNQVAPRITSPSSGRPRFSSEFNAAPRTFTPAPSAAPRTFTPAPAVTHGQAPRSFSPSIQVAPSH